jgi:hypothetical protein
MMIFGKRLVPNAKIFIFINPESIFYRIKRISRFIDIEKSMGREQVDG